ncbi:hypothetical protein BU23DRAFT_552815 [Bimuria novae-zelandiae CBS 107.79]|uniref:Uncharacterized protein n=1 Tax=Bimuria novae-zelandiae CBS 107.79 TaxID=1447943 RepID=A0A6A5VNS3_9PLEO|nr:hypothetical protein BU23DRAFT_552815 [Bimuria novae-zelandiae CBS 107.79]
MPRLHVQIRHVTNTEPVSLQPEDIIEPVVSEDEDVGGRLRKRRRIETIANQYIKLGRVPLIVSAGLRGPFNNGWKNPWATATSGRAMEAVQMDNAEKAESQRAVNPAHRKIKQIKARNIPPDSSAPSPEASRGPEIAQDSVIPVDGMDDEVHASPGPATALQDDSGATEFFSVDPDPSVTFDNFESNPFWLKRPQPRPTPFGNAATGNRDPSPTRARLGHRPIDQHGRLQLVTPRQPINMAQSDPGISAEQEPDWMSTASASMIITPPVGPTQIIQQPMSFSISAKRKRTYSKFERANLKEDRITSSISGTPNLPQNTPNDPPTGPYTRDAEYNGMPPLETRNSDRVLNVTPVNATPIVATTAHGQVQNLTSSNFRVQESPFDQESISGSNARKRPQTQGIHASAKSTTSSRSANTGLKRKKIAVKDHTPAAHCDRVTSPTFASSTGFVYRKIGEFKRKKSSNKPKSRHVTLSSPAKVEQRTIKAAELGSHEIGQVEADEPRGERPDVYDVPGSPEEKQQSCATSRTSGFSTQAALLMAQMDFQDSAMPAIAEDDSEPWLAPVTSTPHEDPIIPSPAFTPFHQFNAALEDDPPEPTMPDIPISTQDLFATVSPFANSTIKKSTRQPASNLRFSVFATMEQDTPSHNGRQSRARSPTSSQRMPLRAKNTRMSLQGPQSEKGSQGEKGSQESITPRPSKGHAAQPVELPQLAFHTSLDDLGRNSDLNFADRFLLNLDGMT